MKKIIIALFLVIATCSIASAQNWSSIEYKFTNGPVSPKYQKSYTIIISPDRMVSMNYTTNTDGPKSDSYSRKISKSQMNSFKKFLATTRFLEAGFNPNFTDNMKVGGPSKDIMITFSNNQATLNLNERLGDKTNLADFNSLAMKLEKFIPSKVWKKLGGSSTSTDNK